MGGMGLVPNSGKNVRSPFLAAVGPTGSITSLCHMIHWQSIQEKKNTVLQCDFATFRQGLEKMAQLYEQPQHPLLG